MVKRRRRYVTGRHRSHTALCNLLDETYGLKNWAIQQEHKGRNYIFARRDSTLESTLLYVRRRAHGGVIVYDETRDEWAPYGGTR